MKFNWQSDKGKHANGEHVQVGRIGQLHVWYDGMRRRGDPLAYSAMVFGHRCPKRFETEAEAKAWCEKWGGRFLRDAAFDVGCDLCPYER